MEQSPSWEANQSSASQEIPCILWNLKVRYRIHNCLPPVPILSQIGPVHTRTSHFLFSHIVAGNEFQFLVAVLYNIFHFPKKKQKIFFFSNCSCSLPMTYNISG